MYCPQCGQQQISETTRFCSRCGLSINGLAEWLATGGIVGGHEDESMVVFSPRRRRIRRGAKLMFLSGVLAPVFLGLGLLVDDPIPLIVPFTIFLVGLSVMLYTLIFGVETSPVKKQPVQPTSLGATFDRTALPRASNFGINVGESPARTVELVQPPSITESTTKLLDRD